MVVESNGWLRCSPGALSQRDRNLILRMEAEGSDEKGGTKHSTVYARALRWGEMENPTGDESVLTGEIL